MILSRSDIRELLNENKNRSLIARALKNEERLRFHCATELDSYQCNDTMRSFLSYVDNILQSEDKSKLFNTLLRRPIPTISLTESILTDLKKVFDGQNGVQEFKFTDSGLREDWERYSKDVLKEHQRWIGEGFNQFKYNINSMIVVDLPLEQKSERPEPYYYWLKLDSVLQFEVKPDTDILEYVIFRTDDKHFVVIDDTTYRVCEYDKEITKFDVVSENGHDLGYCPVCFYWSDYLGTEKCLKESPLSKELDNLDYYIFKVISKRIADLGAEYPIICLPEQEQGCDYEDTISGCKCHDGLLKNQNEEYIHNPDGTIRACPICGNKQFRGSGSIIHVPMPTDGEKALVNPVSIIVTPADTLKYIAENVEKLRRDIYNSVVGYDGYDSGTAMNELQIKSKFENRRTVLNRLKINFENAQKFVEDTICRLRYGKEYIDCVINYGTEFYIYTIEELRARYKEAKASGSSEAELDYLADQIIYTENRTNPVQLQRMLILKQLEPFRHLSHTEVLSLYKDGLADQDMAKIKMNFSALIDRFERENTNIIDFGAGIDFSSKINKINNELKTYVHGN